jgi:hypothetical protein
MKWVALVTWVLTAGGGFFMLGLWLKHGGMRQSEMPGDRIRSARILTHFGLAATGLVLWVVYLATDSGGIAWVAFALLAAGLASGGYFAAARRAGAWPGGDSRGGGPTRLARPGPRLVARPSVPAPSRGRSPGRSSAAPPGRATPAPGSSPRCVMVADA